MIYKMANNKTTVPVQSAEPVKINPETIPGYVAHNIAQVLHRSILEAWNDPQIRAEYEAWKKERAKQQQND